MLQQDKPLVYYDEGLDFQYGNNNLKSEDDEDMDDDGAERDYSKTADARAEQGYCARPNKKGSLSDDSESDEEEDDEEEVEEEEDEEEHEEVSDEEDDFEDDFNRLSDDSGAPALSMVHRPSDLIHYGDSFYPSSDDQPRSIPTTPLPSASTLCSGNSTMELWGDDGSDSYSILSLNASQSRGFNDPMMASQDENLFYSNTYHHQNSYMMSSAAGDHHSNVTLGGYMTVDQSNVINGSFIEDVTLCDKLDKLNDGFVNPEDEVSLSNGTSFTSLVNMVSF